MTTLRQLMKGSLRLINAVAANEEPTDEDMDITLESLNGLVSSLGNDLLNIYTITPYRFLLVPGQASYTLGPAVDEAGNATGANWVTERPMRIEQAVLLQGANVVFPAPPPVSGCCYLSSVQDENTTDLWHFDEDETSGTTTAAVSFNQSPMTLTLGGIFGLRPGACGNGLDLVEQIGYSLYPLDNGGGAWDATRCTYEFVLINKGTVEAEFPLGQSIFRLTWMHYGGEGAAEVFGYLMPGNWLQLRYRYNEDRVLTGIGLPVDVAVPIALQFDIDEGMFTFWANGTQIFSRAIGDFYYPSYEPVGNFVVESASGIIIDELRRSDIARYSDVTYNYLIEGGSCPAPEPKPNEYTWYGSLAARNGYDGDVGIAGYIPTVPLVQIPIAGPQGIAEASACRCVMYDSAFGPIMGGGDRDFVADDGTARPMPVGATYTLQASEYGFYSTPFYFPAKEGDNLWITAADFPGSGQAYSFTVQVGPYGDFRETYVCTGGSQPYEPVTFTITRTA